LKFFSTLSCEYHREFSKIFETALMWLQRLGGINDTGASATGVNDTGGKFAADVNHVALSL
jgi:hypothetical protein